MSKPATHPALFALLETLAKESFLAFARDCHVDSTWDSIDEKTRDKYRERVTAIDLIFALPVVGERG